MTNEEKKVLLVGALGGVAPTLLTLAIKGLGGRLELPTLNFAISFFFGFLVMAFLGGLCVYILEEKVLKKAFFSGMSVPALFSSGLSQITKQSIAMLSLYSSAYAQTDKPTKFIQLEFSKPIPGAFLVSVKNGTKKQLEPIDKKIYKIPMDESIERLFIEGTSVSSYEVLASECEAICVFEVSENKWAGFLEAVGANAPKYKIDLKKGSKIND